MKPLFWIVLTICVSATAAERVASLSPNLTETVVRLGAEDQLVGRSSACDYPESVRKLPVVGRFGVPAPDARDRRNAAERCGCGAPP